VDADVNPRDRRAVFEAIARHFDPAEDLLVLPGMPLDTLDFTSGVMNLGSKMVIDAQSHARHAGSSGNSPGTGVQPAALLTSVPDPRQFDSRVQAHRLAWGGMLVVTVAAEGRAVIETLVRRPELAACKLIVAVSPDVPLDDDELLLWGIFTRFDCARDSVPAHVESRGAWIACRGPLGIDATWKDGYPDPVATPDDVVAKVDGWWGRE